MSLDLLLSHAYFLADDPHEQEIMRPFPPLGMQYLVAYLREHRLCEVDWYDTTFQSGPEAFLAEVDARQPKVVGLYGHTITRPVAKGIVAALLERGIEVLAGGPDPVQYLDEYFDMGVSVVVAGEGEHTLADLVAHLRANRWRFDLDSLDDIEGIVFRRGGEIVRTRPRPLIRPLDQLPWPARERRDLDTYFQAWRDRHGETAMSMVTSRGCPYHCTWCSKQVYGDTYRRRSVDDVIGELTAIKERFGPDQIWFADDLFTINKRWVHRFCKTMVERDAVTPFYLVGRPETFDPATCESLRKAGCYRVYCSAESGAQHVLDAMRKKSTVEDILRAGRLLRTHGIELGVFVMIGYPGERWEDVERTIQMLHELQPEVTLLSVAHPMKGTQFYDEVADRIVHPPGWEVDNGGRLAFEMEYPRRFYELAQRMIWAETGLVKKLRRGEYDAELMKLAVKAPAYRLGARISAARSDALRARSEGPLPRP